MEEMTSFLFLATCARLSRKSVCLCRIPPSSSLFRVSYGTLGARLRTLKGKIGAEGGRGAVRNYVIRDLLDADSALDRLYTSSSGHEIRVEVCDTAEAVASERQGVCEGANTVL